MEDALRSPVDRVGSPNGKAPDRSASTALATPAGCENRDDPERSPLRFQPRLVVERAGAEQNEPDETAHDVTRLLGRWRGGDDRALELLATAVYGELRRMAARCLHRERTGHTLQTHDLIHEAFLRLLKQQHVDWQNRAHFFGIAARMMRRVLTDHARRRLCDKNGGGMYPIVVSEIPDPAARPYGELLAVDEALTELKEVDEGLARIVELRFFAGLRHDEIAAVLEVSVPTVTRRFRIAKAWLYRRLSGNELVDDD